MVIVLLAFIMVLTAMGWFTVVAVFFTQKKIRSSFTRIEKYFNKFFGGLLVLLALRIVFF
jgi:threonine/homoserine/homoserine lactone efflux protein